MEFRKENLLFFQINFVFLNYQTIYFKNKLRNEEDKNVETSRDRGKGRRPHEERQDTHVALHHFKGCTRFAR